MNKYLIPEDWINYNFSEIANALVEAKSAVMTLKNTPYQRSWVEDLQKNQLKREVAGTSQIEGADFTDRELEEALKETPEQLVTRSQKQAHAASQTYRWIAKLPKDIPNTGDLIKDIHRRIVTGADDDHCEPGVLRKKGQNVNFGQPRHRGAEGGKECNSALTGLIKSIKRNFNDHDPIIQALAVHYHFAAIHPFLDGNGRTARALEVLLLQKAGLSDICFIAMSNYYYDEKNLYLNSLNECQEQNHDITSFLKFALKGISIQTNRLLAEIQINIQKAIFRNVMYDLFGRLHPTRKRVLAERQIEILKLLLIRDRIEYFELFYLLQTHYNKLKEPLKAYLRDCSGLLNLKAVEFDEISVEIMEVTLNLNWPKEITETDFFKRIKSMPKAKTYPALH